MNALQVMLDEYLGVRRALGAQMLDQGHLLQQFVESLLVAELKEKSYVQDSLDFDQLQKCSEEMMVKIHPVS